MDVFKSTARVLRDANKVEEYEKLLDAHEQALALQSANASLREENRALLMKISDLHAEYRMSDELVFGNNSYWRLDDDDKPDGPYCPRCWEVESLLVHALPSKGRVKECPKCGVRAIMVINEGIKRKLRNT